MNRITEENRRLAEELTENIMKDHDACGIAVCIIDHTGKVQYEKYWGTRNRETGEPIDGDTIFGLASVTKSFTALSIMKMEEAGILKREDPVSRYLPEFTNRNTKTVTIAHLLSHAGGFFPLPRLVVEDIAAEIGLDEERDGDLAYNEKLAQEGGKRVAERLDEQTMQHGLNGDPGEYLSYCNDGFGLLSEIIRRYGGQPSFAEYLQKNILEPLDMRRSFCDFVRPAEDDNAAVLYRKQDGEMIGDRNYHDNAFVLNGGGAMKSTLNDLKKYLAMYLNEGKGLNGVRVLSERGIREMCRGRIPYGEAGYYGYGLYTGQIDHMTVTQHGGSLPGVSSNIAFTYDNDAAVIVLCNTSDVPVSVISDAMLKMYRGDDPRPDRDFRREYPWSREILQEACGTYSSGEGTEFEITVREEKPVLIEDGKEADLMPVSPTAAIIRRKYSDTYLKLIRTEERGLYCIQYGSRLIPRK